MILRHVVHAGAVACCMGAALMPAARAAEPAVPVKPGISAEANTAVSQMGKTLVARDFSFTAKIIQAYLDQSGQPLHILHSMNVVVHRPDRFAVHATGDDGALDLFYSGKSVSAFWPDNKQYTTIAAPGDIRSALEEVLNKLSIDFPLVDLFADAPGKSFLTGVTAGWQVGTAKIDGVACRHLFFTQRGGVDLELWVENNDAAIPHRLIVTYRLLPGQPDFIAEFTNWSTRIPQPDAAFVFQPPAGAKQVAMAPAVAPGPNGSK